MNTYSSKNKNNKNELGINHWIEPYHRVWNGGLGYHTHHNKIGGAFGKTKREMTIEQEARNRKMKQIRDQVKKGR